MSNRIFVLLIVCCTALSPWSGTATAVANEDADGHIRTVLQDGWGHAVEGPAAVARVLDRAKQDRTANARLYYACGLALLKSYRFDDAMAHFDRAAQLAPPNLPARKAKVWLQVRGKMYPQALAELDQMANIIGQHGTEAATQEQCVSLIGKLIGYMEGPGRVNDDLMDPTRSSILERLSSDNRVIFEESRARVRDRHEVLMAEVVRKQQEALKVQKEQKEVQRQEIAQRLDDLRERRLDSRKAFDDWKRSFEDKMSKLEQQKASSVIEFESSRAQADSVYAAMLRGQQEIDLLISERDAAIENGDTALADRLRRSIALRERELRQLDSQYIAWERRMELARASVNRVAGRRRSATRQYNREEGRWSRELKALDKQEKRLSAEQRNAAKPADGRTAEVNELRRRATFLSTYVRFNLDAERARLLRSLDRSAHPVGDDGLETVADGRHERESDWEPTALFH